MRHSQGWLSVMAMDGSALLLMTFLAFSSELSCRSIEPLLLRLLWLPKLKRRGRFDVSTTVDMSRTR